MLHGDEPISDIPENGMEGSSSSSLLFCNLLLRMVLLFVRRDI
jgi:hypothetical protein